MKMFSGDILVAKISYGHYYFLPAIIYVTCTFDPKEFCLIIENMRRRVDIIIFYSK
jgi:hypothetical protein